MHYVRAFCRRRRAARSAPIRRRTGLCQGNRYSRRRSPVRGSARCLEKVNTQHTGSVTFKINNQHTLGSCLDATRPVMLSPAAAAAGVQGPASESKATACVADTCLLQVLRLYYSTVCQSSRWSLWPHARRERERETGGTVARRLCRSSPRPASQNGPLFPIGLPPPCKHFPRKHRFGLWTATMPRAAFRWVKTASQNGPLRVPE
jgi:hypothetical protein